MYDDVPMIDPMNFVHGFDQYACDERWFSLADKLKVVKDNQDAIAKRTDDLAKDELEGLVNLQKSYYTQLFKEHFSVGGENVVTRVDNLNVEQTILLDKIE